MPAIGAECMHNNWETARISKKGIATLRCRECQLLTKRVQSEVVGSRCPEFFASGYCRAHCCHRIHVNQHKQRLEERFQIHGETVLENIPVGKLGTAELLANGICIERELCRMLDEDEFF
eukprot:TRINITY_DN915_c0_g6_i1.p1 TRINITY_DN915_c0_g6~~TRINITY_DN915_c0_g6_i1.p1  ORF type:complete len:120 (+),score=20.98 TRINITY_DN915_c0_g6_i1:54-413(+)